jgi:hypothetical protein
MNTRPNYALLHALPLFHFDQCNAIHATAGQHKVAFACRHHIAHNASARRDWPSLERLRLRIEANKGVGRYPRLAVPHDVI